MRRGLVVFVAALVLLAAALFLGSRLDLVPDGIFPRPTLAADGELLKVARTFRHSGHVSTIAFSPDGKFLAAGGLLDRSISIWDVRSGALATTLTPVGGGVTALAWSPDSRLLASGRNFVRLTKDRASVTVWEPRTKRAVHDWKGPFDTESGLNDVESLAFDPRGRHLASGHQGGAVVLHDVESGATLQTVTGRPGLGTVLAYSPDGKSLFTPGQPRKSPIEILDGRTGDQLGYFEADLGLQPTLAVSPDGRFVVSAGYDTPAIRLWDVATRRPLRPPVWGHIGPVRALAYHPDGKWIASGSPGDGIKVWVAHTGALVLSLPVGQKAGRTLAFSPDGKYLASTDGETVKLWSFEAAAPTLLRRLRERK